MSDAVNKIFNKGEMNKILGFIKLSLYDRLNKVIEYIEGYEKLNGADKELTRQMKQKIDELLKLCVTA